MRRIVVLAAVLGLVSGLLGAFAFSALSDEASAALFAFVRETNVDANGHIRVHEQGTANVAGTVDVGNLPMDADGNLRVSGQLSAPTGRLDLVAADVDILVGTPLTTEFIDVRDCSSNLAVFVKTPPGTAGLVRILFVLSIDGVNTFATFGGDTIWGEGPNDSFIRYLPANILAPHVALRLEAPDISAHVDQVWLYCAR